MDTLEITADRCSAIMYASFNGNVIQLTHYEVDGQVWIM